MTVLLISVFSNRNFLCYTVFIMFQKDEESTMTDNKTSHTDEGLQGNEQIEQAILALQQHPSQKCLHTPSPYSADECLLTDS